MPQPLICTVFADYDDTPKLQLRYLREEKEELEKMLYTLTGKGKLTGIVKKATDKKNVLNTLLELGGEVRLFHYAGHAGSLSLQLPQSKVRAEGLAGYIGNCPKLKLVVLNGCSTKGFVRELFERTGVAAVIATDNPAGDDACKEFSLTFYNLLLNSEFSTLEGAFNVAISAFIGEYAGNHNIYLLDKQGAVIKGVKALSPLSNATNARSLGEEEDDPLDNANDPAPWGLYITDEETLGWNIYQNDEGINEKLAKKEAEGEVLEKQVTALKEKIRKLERLVGIYKRDPDASDLLADNESELKDTKGALEVLIKNAQLSAEKMGILKAKYEEEKVISMFAESFCTLNYETQMKEVTKTPKNKRFRGFILQGTPDCAVDYLTRRIIKSLQIKETRIIHYDFGSPFTQQGWPWLNIQLGFNFKDHDPDAIVKGMVAQSRVNDTTTRKGYLLLFRNIGKDDPGQESLRDSIVSFIEELIDKFTINDKGTSFQHPIYFFILDDNCGREAASKGYKSSRQQEYEKGVEARVTIRDLLKVFTVVQPLDAEVISTWQINRAFPNELILEEDELEKMLTDSKGNFLPTIKELSRARVDDPNMEKEAYRRFREANVDNDFPEII